MSSSTSTSTGSATSSSSIGPPRGTPSYSLDVDEVIDAIKAVEHPDPDDDRKWLDSMLPRLDLPGFGDRLEDCGDYIPESMHFCEDCYDVKQFPRNCMRYDCPDHGAHAIRRRVAGSSSNAGIAPQLDALRRYLYAYRDDNQYYHHITIEPPEDFFLESDRPLERARETLLPRILDALGIQGVVAYHPWKGDHEDHDSNDLGRWKERLFSDREWSEDVRNELKHKPHFHVVGVAPYIDLEDVGEIYNETGWVIHRIVDEETNVSIEDDDAMARAVLYALSHAGVYETAEQRRLAAWMKGPDVNRVSPRPGNARRMKAIANGAAETTLGIRKPSLVCKNEVAPEIHLERASSSDRDREFIRASQRRQQLDPGEPDPFDGFGGPRVDLENRAYRDRETVSLSSSTSTSEDSTSTFDRRRDRDPDGFGFASGSSGSSGSSSAPRVNYSITSDPDDRDDRPDPDVDDDDLEECSGIIRHISRAGSYLLDVERRERARHADDLEAAYTSYVDVMKGLALEDGRNDVPEFSDRDRPPDD